MDLTASKPRQMTVETVELKSRTEVLNSEVLLPGMSRAEFD